MPRPTFYDIEKPPLPHHDSLRSQQILVNAPIASLDLVEITSDGKRLPLRIELGQPRPNVSGWWACEVTVEGYDNHQKDIYGQDAFQALSLGMRMARLHLDSALSRGSRLVDPEDGSDFPMDAYFTEHKDGPTKPSL